MGAAFKTGNKQKMQLCQQALEIEKADLHNVTLFENSTLLHSAAHEDVTGNALEFLLDQDPSLIERKTAEFETPLDVAARAGNITATKVLLARGAPAENKTLEMLTQYNTDNHTRVAQELLNHGVNPGIITERDSALHKAAWYNNRRQLALFIARHPELVNCASTSTYTRDSSGKTPLHHAVHIYSEDAAACVELLLKQGADAECTDAVGFRPLHLAADQIPVTDAATIIRLLVAANADVNAQTAGGQTPLHCALEYSKNDRRPVIQALLDAQPDIDIADCNGDTPLSLAEKRMHNRCGTLMKDEYITAAQKEQRMAEAEEKARSKECQYSTQALHMLKTYKANKC
jgi:ankyrin repeat protein